MRRSLFQALLLGLVLLVTVPPLALLCRGRSPSRFETANLPAWERRAPRPAPPRIALRAVPLPPGAIQWDNVPWLRTLLGTDENRLLAPLEAPSPATAAHAGDAGRWLETVCALGRQSPLLTAKQDRVALRLMNAQDNDGYLAAGHGTGRWSPPQTLAFSRNLRGLLAYYALSHHTAAIYAAMAAGNLIVTDPALRLMSSTPATPLRSHVNLSALVLPMARLYMLSGETRYRRWALRTAGAGQSDGAGWCALYQATGQRTCLQRAQNVWKLTALHGGHTPGFAAALYALTAAPGYAAALRASPPPWPCPLTPGILDCAVAGHVLVINSGKNWHLAYAGARLTQRVTAGRTLLTVAAGHPLFFALSLPMLAPETSVAVNNKPQTVLPGQAGLRLSRLWKNGDTIAWDAGPAKTLAHATP